MAFADQKRTLQQQLEQMTKERRQAELEIDKLESQHSMLLSGKNDGKDLTDEVAKLKIMVSAAKPAIQQATASIIQDIAFLEELYIET